MNIANQGPEVVMALIQVDSRLGCLSFIHYQEFSYSVCSAISLGNGHSRFEPPIVPTDQRHDTYGQHLLRNMENESLNEGPATAMIEVVKLLIGSPCRTDFKICELFLPDLEVVIRWTEIHQDARH